MKEGVEVIHPDPKSSGGADWNFLAAWYYAQRKFNNDEPFAAIDAKVRQELRQWLRDMITQLGITSIFVTHDQRLRAYSAMKR